MDSFQHRVLRVGFAADQSAWYRSVTDGSTVPCHDGVDITFDPANARTAEHGVSLKLVRSASVGTQVRRTLPTGNRDVNVSFYVKCSGHPGVNIVLCILGSSTNAYVWLSTSGYVFSQVGAGGTQTLATDITDGNWHRIDARYQTGTTTGYLDVQVDGTALTQSTNTITAADITDWNFGSTAVSAAYTTWYSDMVVSGTGTDYPIGDHICKMLTVNGSGTHNPGSAGFIGSDGGTTNYHTYVDDTWDGTTPNLTQTGEDYVAQVNTDTAAYLEFTFTDPTESTIWGAQLAVLMASLDSATADTCRATMYHSTTLLADTGTVDPSINASYYAGYRLTATATPSGGWDGTKLGAVVARWGYSSDAAPDALMNAIVIEYVAPWTGVTVVSGAAAISGVGAETVVGMNEAHAVAALSGVGAASIASLLEIPGASVIAGVGGLTSGSLLEVLGASAIGGIGGLSASALLQVIASAALQATGALSGAALLDVLAAASISGIGGVIVSGDIVSTLIQGICAISGVGGVSAAGLLEVLAASSIAAVGSVSGVPLLIIPASVSMTGAGSASASGLVEVLGQAIINGSVQIVAAGESVAVIQYGSVRIVLSADLTAQLLKVVRILGRDLREDPMWKHGPSPQSW